jgi:hypothetical protein
MRIVILSSIISPLPSARWQSSPNVCDARRRPSVGIRKITDDVAFHYEAWQQVVTFPWH